MDHSQYCKVNGVLHATKRAAWTTGASKYEVKKHEKIQVELWNIYICKTRQSARN